MAVDSNWSSVVLLCPFSSDLTDVKGNTVTVNGDSAISATVGNPFGAGNACHFDGTGDYLTVPRLLNSVALSIGMWVYVSSATEQAFFSQYNSGSDGRLSLYINSSGKLEFFIGASSSLLITDTSTFTTGSWRFIEACRDGSGNAYLFNHGTLVATGTSTQVPYNGVSSIGGQYGPTAGLVRPMTGYISQARVDNGYCRNSVGYSVPTAVFPRPMLTGTVYDSVGAKASKVVVAIKRSNMTLAGQALSDGTLGTYTIYPSDFSEHIVAEFDTATYPLVDGGSGENALIYDRVIPG